MVKERQSIVRGRALCIWSKRKAGHCVQREAEHSVQKEAEHYGQREIKADHYGQRERHIIMFRERQSIVRRRALWSRKWDFEQADHVVLEDRGRSHYG